MELHTPSTEMHTFQRPTLRPWTKARNIPGWMLLVEVRRLCLRYMPYTQVLGEIWMGHRGAKNFNICFGHKHLGGLEKLAEEQDKRLGHVYPISLT